MERPSPIAFVPSKTRCAPFRAERLRYLRPVQTEQGARRMTIRFRDEADRDEARRLLADRVLEFTVTAEFIDETPRSS